MDITPVTEGHALVVRSHATDLLDVSLDDLAACAAVPGIARRAKERLGADGVNLLNRSGVDAWRSVFHFHIHVIPRTATSRRETVRSACSGARFAGDIHNIARIGSRLA